MHFNNSYVCWEFVISKPCHRIWTKNFKPRSYCRLYLGSYFSIGGKIFLTCFGESEMYSLWLLFHLLYNLLFSHKNVAIERSSIDPFGKTLFTRELIGVNKQATHTKDVHKQKYYYFYFFSIIFSTTTTKWTTKFKKCGHQFLCWWSLVQILCLKHFCFLFIVQLSFRCLDNQIVCIILIMDSWNYYIDLDVIKSLHFMI